MQSSSNFSSFAKGMGVGIAAGAAMLFAGKMLMKDTHHLSKGSSKAMKAVGDFVDGIQTMIK